MYEAFMISGIWFIGFGVIFSGIWISAELNELCKMKDEINNIWFEIRSLR